MFFPFAAKIPKMKTTSIGVFEDDLVNRFLYDRMFQLKDGNLEWNIFDHPEKGYAHAIISPFNIVMIELHFWEDFGGIEILNRLKRICGPELISIAVTSLLQQGDVEKVLAAGFTMCVEKPVVLEAIDVLKRSN
jgi:CheY-like chemotaxis protein